jgi:hypothetical protein
MGLSLRRLEKRGAYNTAPLTDGKTYTPKKQIASVTKIGQ